MNSERVPEEIAQYDAVCTRGIPCVARQAFSLILCHRNQSCQTLTYNAPLLAGEFFFSHPDRVLSLLVLRGIFLAVCAIALSSLDAAGQSLPIVPAAA